MQNHKVSSSSWYNLSASFACSFFFFLFPLTFFSVTSSSALNCSLMFFYDVMWLRRWAGFTLWRSLSPFFPTRWGTFIKLIWWPGKKESASARAPDQKLGVSPAESIPVKEKEEQIGARKSHSSRLERPIPPREPRSGNKPAVKRSSIITQTTWNNNPTNHSWNGPL